ncbi:MAG: wax ester/triacylglycerol synthase family O-acyltransferase [Proteobacteria bacterium]|nr:wax ester/triacylglycerol synthase family O-acyltransferase [Pseudomonadota bacterium]
MARRSTSRQTTSHVDAEPQAARKLRREPMSRVDTAWLRMEKPTNLMMITGVLMFDTPMPIARLRQVIGDRFLAYPRFRQKAVDGPAGATWEEDGDFVLDWHVRLSALPGRAGKRELERFVSNLASTPLDQSKPLWQFHLIESYRGGSALVARIHHCYADGIALVQVLLSLTDASAEPETQGQSAWLDEVKAREPQGSFERYRKLGGKMLARGVQMGAKLYEDPSLAAVLAHEGKEIARELANAVVLPDDPPTVLKGRLGVSKRVAWADPLDLDEVKAVSRAFQCTVNDVLLASAAGALRSYLIERGEAIDGVTLRATVPVNLRPLKHAKKLGNHFGLVFLELPVGEDNPVRRLERVAAHMDELKNSRQAIVSFGLLAALGMAPAALQRIALDLFSRKATAVATNVPGPKQPLYMAGQKMREMMFWVPQTGGIGVGISILSYENHVHFGLIGDARLMPDPDAVIGRFAPEFEKLLYVAMMGDWDARVGALEAEMLREITGASVVAG